jgi:hypothetical protein
MTERARDGILGAIPIGWADPDMEVPGLHRRSPPHLPFVVFGEAWGPWIAAAANAAACPADYVAMPLLATASALIGNARWPSAGKRWKEPPHLWIGPVGDSGTGKSPGADALMDEVLPELERRMCGDYPDRHRLWCAETETHAAAQSVWKSEVRSAQKMGTPPPDPPSAPGPEPQMPRLVQSDTTIEKVATLLAQAAPKGLMIVRDEIAGWIAGMSTYNDAGRQFWLEAYGGRFYRVERQKHPEPIDVPRLAVAVYGGTQPDRLARLLRDPDDGLLARFLWSWPTPVPFDIAERAPDIEFAIRSLDRLRMLELFTPGLMDTEEKPRPVLVPLDAEALTAIKRFGGAAQIEQEAAAGLMRSAWGKARGHVLRLALVLEFLWWCAIDGIDEPPRDIGVDAIDAAITLVREYFLPMAERVYGDASATAVERHAAMLARWILKTSATEVYVRDMLRNNRLAGMTTADAIHDAAKALVEADWLFPPTLSGDQGRRREAYRVNPRVFELSRHAR